MLMTKNNRKHNFLKTVGFENTKRYIDVLYKRVKGFLNVAVFILTIVHSV